MLNVVAPCYVKGNVPSSSPEKEPSAPGEEVKENQPPHQVRLLVFIQIAWTCWTATSNRYTEPLVTFDLPSKRWCTNEPMHYHVAPTVGGLVDLRVLELCTDGLQQQAHDRTTEPQRVQTCEHRSEPACCRHRTTGAWSLLQPRDTGTQSVSLILSTIKSKLVTQT